VNEKLVDFVMAGVSSVVGGLSRHTVLEAIVQFDSNFVKRWLVRFLLLCFVRHNTEPYHSSPSRTDLSTCPPCS
jgi:hypothetical protein